MQISTKSLPELYKNNWIRGKDDPDTFVSVYCSTASKTYKLLPHQSFFLKQFRSNNFEEMWMAGGNSGGKTFTGKFLGVWAANYKLKPGRRWKTLDEFTETPYNVLCTGPEQKQAIELWEKIEETFKTSPFLKHKVASITIGSRRNTHPQIVLKNGSTIEAVGLQEKGKHVEGEAYDLILINEPPDVRHLQFILDKVLIPRTWRRGGVICGFGTPKGKGEYWTVARRGIPNDVFKEIYGGHNQYLEKGVFTSFVDARDNTFADQEKIGKSLEKSKDFVDERVKGWFVDSTTLAFPDNDIEKNIDESLVLPIRSSSGHQYMHGVDFGRKEDYTVCFTADITVHPHTIVNFYRKGGGVATWEEIMSDLLQIYKQYKGEMVVDATASSGDIQTEWLRDMGISYIPFQFGGSPAKKVQLINNLQDMLAKGMFRMPYIDQLSEELHSYPRDMNDKGLSTDSVMSLALLAHGIKNYGIMGEPVPYTR